MELVGPSKVPDDTPVLDNSPPFASSLLEKGRGRDVFEDETRDYWDDYLPLGGLLVREGALRWEWEWEGQDEKGENAK